MLIRILGSAAGGGFPQWNCNAVTSRAARRGDWSAIPRTQSSLAVSADGRRWVLLNASPDIRQQIAATPALQPRQDGPLRDSPIKAVVLTNADVDHVAGLLSLRERQAFTIYAAQRVLDVLAANSIFNVLSADCVTREPMQLGEPRELQEGGASLGIAVEPFVVPGKIALYLEDEHAGPGFGSREGDTIGVRISEPASGASFFYIPGCAVLDEAVRKRIRGARLVLFDGTLFTDDELVSQGLSEKTGKRMGHISMSGPEGSIAAFGDLAIARRVFVHMNTSNPALIEGSPERLEVEQAGWEISWDGMEIEL